jgi:Zn-dependent peptidase ImmA (M78 family)/transcriptional regulator with XRE-family HTH domain
VDQQRPEATTQFTLRLDDEPEAPGFNPSRLAVARRRRGMTKTDLALAVGLELRTISAYEAGEFKPSAKAVADLGRVLKFPVTFFFGEDLHEPIPDTASFRAQSKMNAWQRDMALSQGAIALHLNSWLEGRFELPNPAIPEIGRDQTPEAAAEALRHEWGLGVGEVRNTVHLLESKGVRIFALSVKAKEVDAFSMWRGGTPFVFLNTQKTAEHSRFDAAHELGHLVLHRHAAPQGRQAEKEADAFASAFLMPRASVLAHAPKFTTVEALIRLKKVWSVSAAALAYRFHTLKVLSDWHYRNIYVELSKRGYTKNEPDPAPHEASQLLAKAFSALQEEGVTRQQVARDLCVSTTELDDLLLGLAFGRVDGGKQPGSQGPLEKRNLIRLK